MESSKKEIDFAHRVQWVYTDRDQCEKFGVPYFGEAELTVGADRLLHSKGGDGYDREHQAYLKEFGSKVITLLRDQGFGPGWWKVTSVEVTP